MSAAQDAPRESVRTYFFGNSLVTHVGGGDETAVPHWIAQLALADGRSFAADGQFGFLRNFAADLPPLATWGFGKVRRAWRRGAQPFGEAGFDSVVISPANFIQDIPPDAAYRDGSGQSPLGETLKIIDWLTGQDPDLRIFIYGGWPEMANITPAFPPGPEDLSQYHRIAQGVDVEWYRTYVAALSDARPDADIRLIPVGQRLSRTLSTPPFDSIPALSLYEDNAPHGTPTLYAMAAIVTYGALYGSPPPADFAWPASVHPVLRDNAEQAIALLTDATKDARPLPPAASAETAPAPTSARPTDTAASPAPEPTNLPAIRPAPDKARLDLDGPPGVGLADPALAMGLNGVEDWTAQQPFLDLMKTARPWIGHSAETWGAFPFERLQELGAISAEGWPTRLPDGANRIETFVLTDMSPDAATLEGTYVLRWKGQGKVEVTARARRPRYDDGQITFQYRPDEGLVGIVLTQIDPTDPIRDITLVREDRVVLHDAGAIFNPDWLAVVSDLRSVRFMDWMRTNASPVTTWDDRPRVTDATYAWRGVPLEVMLRLTNRIGADPWFTLPHMADDAYMAEFAVQVRDGLDPRLQAYVEYSNELWNFAFPQTQWAAAQAEARWGPGQPDDAWIQFAGARMAEMAEIWEAAFGEAFHERVKVVMAVHTGWQGLEQAQMQAPLWRADMPGRRPPADHADAYAVTGYFGFGFGTEAFAPTVDSWIEDSIATATAAGEAEGKQRVALREYVKERQFDTAFTPAANALRQGGLRDLITTVWPYHARVAQAAGMELIMYEGGTHVAGFGNRVNDDRLTAFFTEFNYTPDMARLYDTLLAGWVDVGGTLFNAFVDVATPTKWGSWGAQRYLGDNNPRWQSLERYNRTARPAFAARAPGTFLNGVTRIGTASRDVLEGTVEEDVLIAGAGNDLLISHGRGDALHGGPGRDTAQLPGQATMYRFTGSPERAEAHGPHGTVTLVEIEEILFEGDGSRAVPLTSLF
ncbi:hypothetical protein ATO11_13405 [Pseudaestuariivita atlantica]|uniref:Type I secretion protein n=2 Tax=Pseudaestuariivita atlantica TaxID=1317121 RepID=A0A0L1JP20_9RHOB|nr:hypothetical protein ATO11_13405 [Pseudaestuariivita atlantica]